MVKAPKVNPAAKAGKDKVEKKIKNIAKKSKNADSNVIKTKKQLIKETLKENESTAPVKNVKKDIINKSNKKNKNELKIKETAPQKPLVLAPPKSPVAPEPKKDTDSGNAQKPVMNGKVKKTQKDLKAKVVKETESSIPIVKQQLKKKLSKKNKLTSVKAARALKEVKTKPVKKEHEPIPFDEEAFDKIVNIANVTKIVNALKTLVEKEVSAKKTSIFSDYNYCLNVSSFKIASCPKRVYRVNLKHPLVDLENNDVVIIVRDLKRGAKAEYDSTTEHYTDLFREAGVENLKIMPFNQLRNEFKTFEAKRKLANTYDYFLCDGRIMGHVAGFCGTLFQKGRTILQAVRMDNPTALKSEIEKSLRRTAYKQISKGDLISIAVANDKFTSEQVAENVLHVVAQLKNNYPGGLINVRGIDLKLNLKGTSSLPIYVSSGIGPDEAPYVVGPREQRMLKLRKDANEVLSKFNLTKDAEISKLSPNQIKKKLQLQKKRAELLAEGDSAEQKETKVNAKKIVPPKKEKKEQKMETEETEEKSVKVTKSVKEEVQEVKDVKAKGGPKGALKKAKNKKTTKVAKSA